jgi:hypothetical protein
MRPRNDVRKLLNYNRLPQSCRELPRQLGDRAGLSATILPSCYEQISGATYLTGDTNGDGLADFMIKVDGNHVFTGADLGL